MARVLAKNPDDRYQTASDLRTDLGHLKRDTETGLVSIIEGQGRKTEQQWLSRKWKLVMVGLVLISLLGIGVTWLAKRNTKPAPPPELKETRLTADPSENGVSLASISPDGKYLAYSVQWRLYLKLIESGEVRPIPQPEGLSAENTSWMAGRWFPDGTRFLAQRSDAARNLSTWVISVLGGPPRLLRKNSEPQARPRRMALRLSIWPATESELWLMGAQGENPRKVLTAPKGDSLTWPLVPRQPADRLPARATATRIPSRVVISKAAS